MCWFMLFISADSLCEVTSPSATLFKDKTAERLTKQQIQLEREAKAKIKVFADTLKQTLVSAIQSGGFAEGVNVCKNQAPVIAESLSTDGWQVARTSLKVRNTDNQASNWEQETLKGFDAKFKKGVSPDSIDASLLTETSFRYMKAIPTGQICLSCHGPEIDKTLQQTITAQYPLDSATGFTLNDIRGAFTLHKAIE